MPTVFVKPNTKKAHYGATAPLSAIEPPVWLVLMAQASGDGSIIDMEAEGLDNDGLIARLQALAADRVVILATGSHPSAHIQQGEAARAIKMFVAGRLRIPVDVHTDHLPFDPLAAGGMDLARIPVEKYRAHNWHAWGRKDRAYGATFASISCPYRCDFCCVKDFYRSDYRQRDAALVAADVQAWFRRGVSNIKMMDELFAIDNTGVNAVCDVLAATGFAEELNIWAYARVDTVTPTLLKKMRRAGVRWLAYGIESGDEKVRAGALKGNFSNARIRDAAAMTRDAGIHVLGNFMFGFEDDDMRSMHMTLDLARTLQCEYANFYCVSPYPGSKLYDRMKAAGALLPSTGEEYAQMSPRFKPAATRHLSGKDVLAFRDAAFMEYFTDTAYLNMMAAAFGPQVTDEIRAMTAIPMRREP